MNDNNHPDEFAMSLALGVMAQRMFNMKEGVEVLYVHFAEDEYMQAGDLSDFEPGTAAAGTPSPTSMPYEVVKMIKVKVDNVTYKLGYARATNRLLVARRVLHVTDKLKEALLKWRREEIDEIDEKLAQYCECQKCEMIRLIDAHIVDPLDFRFTGNTWGSGVNHIGPVNTTRVE